MHKPAILPLLVLSLLIGLRSPGIHPADQFFWQDPSTPTPTQTVETLPANTPTPTITSAPTAIQVSTATPKPAITPTSTQIATPQPVTTGTPTPTQLIPPQATLTPAKSEVPTSQAFQITGIEPDSISRETGGAISIYGEGFGSGTVARLGGYGLLDTAVINSTALRAIVPPGLKEKEYDLEVILGDGRTIVIEGALRVKAAKPTPTFTPTPAGVSANLQPQLLVQSTRTEPEKLRPGMPFVLHLDLINQGNYTATNIRLTLQSLEIAVPVGGSNLVVLEPLAANQQQSVELSLALNKDTPSGYNNLEVVLEYSDYYGRNYTSSQNIGLQIQSTPDSQPIVLITSYETRPETLTPGDPFTLQLHLTNVGRGEARQLLLTLGSSEGASTAPFAVMGSGNIKFVSSLPGGETILVEQQFILDGSAESGVYSLPTSLAYDSPDGVRLSETQVLNLLATRRPQLRIAFYQPVQTGKIDQPLELPVEVVNIGRTLVNASTIELTGENMEIENGSTFVGSLDAGTSGSLDAIVIPKKSGALPVTLTVNYLDDFNHPRVITHTLAVEIEPPPTPPPDVGTALPAGEKSPGLRARILLILRGLLGLGS